MAAIVLTALKITGIILVVILALVLALLALVLFVPFRYRAVCDKSDPQADFTGQAKVTYLLHIISAGVIYDGEMSKYIRIFGIKLRPKKDKKTQKSKKQPKSPNEESTGYEEALENDYSIDWNDTDIKEADTDEEPSSKESFADKFDRIADGISSRYEEYKDKIDKLKKEVRFWDKMFHDERNRNAVSYVSVKALKLLKKISPKRIKGFAHFGFEDPATTGQVLVYLSMIYPVLPKKLKIEPSFTDTDIYGKVDIKGKIALISVAVPLLAVYFNKDCRRLWRLYKRHQNK